MTDLRLIPRAEWGARHDDGTGSRKLPTAEAWLHHSVTIAPDLVPPFDDDYAAIRELEDIGEQRFGSGISYNRLFTPAGLAFVGVSAGRIGTHTANHNTVAMGYCLVGNYDVTTPTDAMITALAWCLQEDHRLGYIDRPALDGGHRDLKATACPGKYAYDLIAEVNRRAAGPPITNGTNTEQERRADVSLVVTCATPNHAGILSGGTLVDITGDKTARESAQANINRGIMPELKVQEGTWNVLYETSLVTRPAATSQSRTDGIESR